MQCFLISIHDLQVVESLWDSVGSKGGMALESRFGHSATLFINTWAVYDHTCWEFHVLFLKKNLFVISRLLIIMLKKCDILGGVVVIKIQQNAYMNIYTIYK